ncbi:hypothetical protein HDV03_001536 [Kappamyces sp. JEL0829]|nr:hypothetical protein HDV03_001536 [Kappamyces sp. JEL0829]
MFLTRPPRLGAVLCLAVFVGLVLTTIWLERSEAKLQFSTSVPQGKAASLAGTSQPSTKNTNENPAPRPKAPAAVDKLDVPPKLADGAALELPVPPTPKEEVAAGAVQVVDVDEEKGLLPVKESLKMAETRKSIKRAKKPPSQYPSVDDPIPEGMPTPQVCVVARTYSKQYSDLYPFLFSLSQNKARPLVYLLITDRTSSRAAAQEIVTTVNGILGEQTNHLLPITPADARKHLDIDTVQEYGYAYTDAAIDLILHDKQTYPCDYFIFTNGDNLYSKGFIDDYIAKDMKQGLDIMAFDFVSRYVWSLPSETEYHTTDGTRLPIRADFKVGNLDLGAFVVRAGFIAKWNLRFLATASPLRQALGNQSKQLCVVARTYHKTFPDLPSFILSLSQNTRKPIVYLLVTDKNSSHSAVQVIADKVNGFLGYPMAQVLPVTAAEAAPHFNLDDPHEYGYAYTDAAADLMLRDQQAYPCDYFIFTNGDNLYSKGLVDDYLAKDMEDDLDIVGFDFVSHHPRESAGTDRYIENDGTRIGIRADFQMSFLDLGAFMIKASFMEQQQLRFVPIGLRYFQDHPYGPLFFADGMLIEEASRRTEKKKIHRQTLMLHQ